MPAYGVGVDNLLEAEKLRRIIPSTSHIPDWNIT